MLANQVLMIYPEHFDVNPEIVLDNFFLKNISGDKKEIRKNVLKEFEELKSKLESAGIEVFVFNPPFSSPAPDAVFPNNWFSTHPDGTLVIYPMMSPLRRIEKHPEVLAFLKQRSNTVIDLTENENQNHFLEGTGSIVIEHRNKIAFASESLRTNTQLFNEWCQRMKYEPVLFHATDENKKPIYHTNVILTIAENFTIICLESIRDENEKDWINKKLLDSNLTLVEITFEQVKRFSGNALTLKNKKGEQVLVISEQGWNAFEEAQKNFLQNHCAEIITAPLDTIEACGGGSARCMLAELFY